MEGTRMSRLYTGQGRFSGKYTPDFTLITNCDITEYDLNYKVDGVVVEVARNKSIGRFA